VVGGTAAERGAAVSKVFPATATSIEEVFVHEETGERIIRHTVVEGDTLWHETFRPYSKFE
jgi:hypothetical protein